MGPVLKVGVGVLILREDKILLGHRVAGAKDTGGIYEPDSWCLPGGKQEYGETMFEAAAREVKEETGLIAGAFELFSAADDIQPGRHFVTLQIVARTCAGEARAMEPDKQDEWRWFGPDALPKNLYSPSEKFIRAFFQKKAE